MEIDKLFGIEDETDDEEIEDEEVVKDDYLFWEFWGDTEWEQILKERKESGNSLRACFKSHLIRFRIK